MQPRIFGPYEAIRRDYPIEEYLADIRPCGIEKSVYVQTNWPPGGELEEAAWVQQVADRHGFPHAFVGYADLQSNTLASTLDTMGRYRGMRGIRQQIHWHENATYRFAQLPALMNEASWRRGLRAVADRGLLFELQVFTSQMADAARLASAFGDLTFVLLHAGMLEDTSTAGRAAWRDGMQRLAQLPNLHVKLSGLGTFIHRVDRQHIAEIALPTIELFGAGRCVFGSNFPIEKLWSGYADLVDAYRAALAPLSEVDQAAVFSATARRLYRL